MKQVFEVRPDVNDYQKLYPCDDAMWDTGLLDFDCTRKASTWTPFELEILDGHLRRGHFLGLAAGAFVIDAYARDRLDDLLSPCVEYLPIEYDREPLWVVNVLACRDALDQATTEWEYGLRSEKRIAIEKYVFDAERLTEDALFKLPETARGQILTATQPLSAPSHEFKARVDAMEDAGLRFDLLWSEGESP